MMPHQEIFFGLPRSHVFPFGLLYYYKPVPISQTVLGAFVEFHSSKAVMSGTTDSRAFGHTWTLNLGFVDSLLVSLFRVFYCPSVPLKFSEMCPICNYLILQN